MNDDGHGHAYGNDNARLMNITTSHLSCSHGLMVQIKADHPRSTLMVQIKADHPRSTHMVQIKADHARSTLMVHVIASVTITLRMGL